MKVSCVAIAVLAITMLAGCGGDDSKGGSSEVDQPSPDPVEDLEDLEDFDPSDLDLGGEISLDVGDCWGRDDEIVLDPIPCDGPHIFEVVGRVDDWDHESFGGGFEGGRAEEDATRKLCDELAAGYFGHDPLDDGIQTDNAEPKYYGRPEVILCSSHSGPDVERVRDEVTGSFADRGYR